MTAKKKAPETCGTCRWFIYGRATDGTYVGYCFLDKKTVTIRKGDEVLRGIDHRKTKPDCCEYPSV